MTTSQFTNEPERRSDEEAGLGLNPKAGSSKSVDSILSEMDEALVLDAFDIITSVDPKIEEDDPVLLVKTDYTPY